MPARLIYRPNHYYQYAELEAFLRQAVRAHPKLAKLHRIGKSYQKRDLLLLEITNQATGPGDEKPGYWMDGNMHATEVSGSAVCLYSIFNLLTKRQSDVLVGDLLDRCVFYILPRSSPDGAEEALTSGRRVRSSMRYYPFPEPQDGLIPSDINGDGEILQMRIADPLGEWKQSTKDRRLLIKRKPDDRTGKFYRLYLEGTWRNFDGFHRLGAAPEHGLDHNRNYPYDWANEARQGGSGELPLSEPETRAIAEFIVAHPNIGCGLNYHTFSGVHLRAYCDRPDTEFNDFDLAVFKAIGARATEITGYPTISTHHDFRYHPTKGIKGDFTDWLYEHRGIYAYVTELWSMATHAGIEVKDFIKFIRERTEEEDLKLLKWTDRELKGKGFADWTPFEHPQVGRVEIGGWRTMYTWSNPPAHLLPAECEKNFRFNLAHAAALPQLVISEFRSEPVSDGVRKLTLVIENRGWLPTQVSQKAVESKAVRPIQIALKLPRGAKLLNGKAKFEQNHLTGMGNAIVEPWATSFWFGGAPNTHQERFEWVVQGAGPVSVEVKSQRAGVARAGVK